jgi:hypothetical protein
MKHDCFLNTIAYTYSLRFKILVTIDFFFVTMIIRLIQRIVQIKFILFAICFNVVCILSLTYHFTCLRQFFE